MEDTYPMLESKGGKYSVTFRFPVFNDTIIYDPAVSLAESSGPTSDEVTTTGPIATGPGGGSSKLVPSLWAALILGVFLRLFF
jgi:hypothetical protein